MTHETNRPQGPLMLLDAASLYFRAFYGVPDRRSDPSAPPTNAVTGLLDMIATLVTVHRPGGLVACWDDDWRPAFRVEAIPTYKAHRVATTDGPQAEEVPPELSAQVPVIEEVLAAIGVSRLGCPGYEADDVIGTLTTRTARQGRAVRIVTGDRDLFQLVDDHADVVVVYTARGGVRGADLVDETYLRTHYDVGSGDLYADLAVLRGDPSDGLPGVKGIGAKTGARLLAEYGDLAGLREAVLQGHGPSGATGRRLAEAADYLDVAVPVVRVARDCPLPDVDGGVSPTVADPGALADLVERYQIGSSVTRALDALGIHP